MIIPGLKRIKVSSEQELRTWLAKNAGCGHEVMIVTCNQTSSVKHVSGSQVRAALHEHGWTAGRSYTLAGNLNGHVAKGPGAG